MTIGTVTNKHPDNKYVAEDGEEEKITIKAITDQSPPDKIREKVNTDVGQLHFNGAFQGTSISK